jgi:hypothetical protein
MEAFMFVLAAVGGELAAIEHLRGRWQRQQLAAVWRHSKLGEWLAKAHASSSCHHNAVLKLRDSAALLLLFQLASFQVSQPPASRNSYFFFPHSAMKMVATICRFILQVV